MVLTLYAPDTPAVAAELAPLVALRIAAELVTAAEGRLRAPEPLSDTSERGGDGLTARTAPGSV